MKVKNLPDKDLSTSITIRNIKEFFSSLYKVKPQVISRAPGRAEIIGCHTDYNYGFALGAALPECTYAAVSKRSDDKIIVFSKNFDLKPLKFSISNIAYKENNHWSNYIKAIVSEFSKHQLFLDGFNLYVTSNVPYSGGVSSSAALELAVGSCLNRLYNINIPKIDLAVLCQRAENSPIVSSPCGFLDQGTSALSQKGKLVFFDFKPQNHYPFSKIDHIKISLNSDVSFLIVVDKKVKRNLGETGYPKRRKQCEQSLHILSKLLNKKISSLRDINSYDFKKCRNRLGKISSKIRMRVEHIVYENKRVLDAVSALKRNDLGLFGKILTESGRSALSLYELDEKTPELTFLVKKASNMEGVLGTRNMGGGFSANILVLIQKKYIKEFSEKLSTLYKKAYNSNLDIISFQPEDGASLI
jgi:galactokinase